MVDKISFSLDGKGDKLKLVAGDGVAGDETLVREQDRLLPIANVGRIMKRILPPNAKISKEAKETMQECVSEFISFVTGEASDKCHREKRKTINGDDICWALGSLGLEDLVEPMKRYLARYREVEGERSANQNKPSPGCEAGYDDRNSIYNPDEGFPDKRAAPIHPISADYFTLGGIGNLKVRK